MNLCSSIIDLLRGKKVIDLVFAIQQAGAQNHLPILEKLAEAGPAPFVIVEGSGKDTKKKPFTPSAPVQNAHSKPFRQKQIPSSENQSPPGARSYGNRVESRAYTIS